MKLTLKLNIGNFQNIDIETNDYSEKDDCYKELYEFLGDWLEITEGAKRLRENVMGILDLRLQEEAEAVVQTLKAEDKQYNADDIKPKIKIVSPGFENETKVTEEVIQDLKQVTPMQGTFYEDGKVKSLLIVKNGYQTWVIGKAIESEFEAGKLTDLKVAEWGLKKLKWIPYQANRKLS